MICRSATGDTRADGGAGSDRNRIVRPAAWARRIQSPYAAAATGARSIGERTVWLSRARSRIEAIVDSIRSTSASVRVAFGPVGRSAPASSSIRSAVSGVFSWCVTSAVSARSRASTASSRRAAAASATPAVSSSSIPLASGATAKSPASSRRAASASRFTGAVRRRTSRIAIALTPAMMASASRAISSHAR